MSSISGRGFGGISTSGSENIKTTISRPNIAGSEFGPYKAKSNGIKIRYTNSKKKSKKVNPKI